MKKPTLVVGAGALTLLVVALGLILRPGNDPVAAQQPTPVPSLERSGPAVARLGSQQIDVQELKVVMAALPADSREQLRTNRSALETWLRSRLAQKAVLEQARAAAEQIVFRDYMLSVSKVPADYPSQAELQAAYDTGKAQWVTPPLYRVSQIFLAATDPQNVDVVARKAQELSRKAQSAPGEFIAMAKQYSQESDSATRGGDSGLQPLQQLVPEVRNTVARLKVGAVSEVVQSAAGFHVLKLIEQRPARTATLDELRERLTQALRDQRQEQIAKSYLEGMLNTATLSIDGAELNKLLE